MPQQQLQMTMRLASICLLALLSTSCATSQLDRASMQALRTCFYTPPERVGEAGVLPETENWRLVSRRRADPYRDTLNPYVTSGCSSKTDCYEYWFQRASGDIRYCVTDGCQVSSVGFRIVNEQWTASEGNEFVCTS